MLSGILGDYIKTLYTGTTDDFDSFEKDMVMKLSSHNKIEWWYRNPSYNGFCLNYYDNHYPDFIAKLKSGKIILIETKGNHLENPQSEEKAKVGKIWAELSGRNYRYYMVFKEKAANIKDSCTVAELDERLNKL